MFTLRGVVAVGVSLALAVSAFAAPTFSAKSRASRGSGIEGTVVQVHHEKGKGNAGSIEIRRTHHHHSGKKGGKTAATGKGRGQTRTVLVNASTRFQRQGGKGAASLHSIHPGERVRVILASGKQGHARVVEILSGASKRSSNRVRSLHRGGGQHARRYVSRRPRSGAAGLAQAAKHPNKSAVAKHKAAEKKRTTARKPTSVKKNKHAGKPKTANKPKAASKPKSGHAKSAKPAHGSARKK